MISSERLVERNFALLSLAALVLSCLSNKISIISLRKDKLSFLIVNVKNLGISRKKSVEVCRFVRNKTTSSAKKMLERVIEKKQAVPYKRYVREIPHRKGKMATGGYPLNVSKTILSLIKSAEANAQNKGMSSNLIIHHISAHKGESQPRYGRKSGRQAKRTHIKIIVKEKK
jgi:large subunit ribosomal protein L22